jgi:hypothetical protein
MVEWGIYTGANDGSWVIAPPALGSRSVDMAAFWLMARAERAVVEK